MGSEDSCRGDWPDIMMDEEVFGGKERWKSLFSDTQEAREVMVEELSAEAMRQQEKVNHLLRR